MRSNRFRLPRADRGIFGRSGEILGFLEFAGWLTPEILWIDGWLTSASHQPLTVTVVAGGVERQAEAHRLCFSRADLRAIPRAAGQTLAVAVPELAGQSVLEALTIHHDGAPYRWTLRRGLGIQPDLVTHWEERFPALSPEVRREIVDFLAEDCAAVFDIQAGDKLFQRNLLAARRALRARASEDGGSYGDLAPYQASPDQPVGLSIDQLVVVDAESVFLRGWIWDVENLAEELEIVSPGGARTPTLGSLARARRPGVTETFRPGFGRLAEGRHGFFGLVRPAMPAAEHLGYGFDLRLRSGRIVRAGAPPRISDPFFGRDAVLRSLPPGPPYDVRLVEQVHPALDALRDACRSRTRVVGTLEAGAPPSSPDVSLVIPSWRRPDLVEHQLAQFADDPAIAECELIYVIEGPEAGVSFEERAFHLSRLYDLALRGVVVTESAGYAAAVNLAAEHARGRLLVLMHTDVIPDQPGWVKAMAELCDSREDVGLVGAKLLYEDGSLQHGGVELPADGSADGLVTPRDPLKGMPRDHPQVRAPRKVPAVSGACAMIRRALFEEVGGFADRYVAGDFEDYDLALRCTDAGKENWCQPGAELFHLEGMSKTQGPGWQRNPWARLYNRWLLTRLVGAA